jgi:uncharacterized membrane protein (DUF441 family)
MMEKKARGITTILLTLTVICALITGTMGLDDLKAVFITAHMTMGSF